MGRRPLLVLLLVCGGRELGHFDGLALPGGRGRQVRHQYALARGERDSQEGKSSGRVAARTKLQLGIPFPWPRVDTNTPRGTLKLMMEAEKTLMINLATFHPRHGGASARCTAGPPAQQRR